MRNKHTYHNISHADAAKIMKRIKMKKNASLFPNVVYTYETLADRKYDIDTQSWGCQLHINPAHFARCSLTVDWDKQ